MIKDIVETVNEIEISFKLKENDELWLNATKLVKQTDKLLDNYWKSPETLAYMEEVVSEFGVNTKSMKFNDLKKTLSFTKRGNNGGTFIHPELSIHFTRWLNVKFSRACDKAIKKITKNGYYISEEAKVNPSDELIKDAKGILDTRLGIDNTRDELISHINAYLKDEEWNPHSLPNAISNCYQHLHIATKGMIASQVLEEVIRTSPDGLELTNWRQKRKVPKVYSADYGVAQNYYTDKELEQFNNRFVAILQRVVTHINLYPKLTPMTVLALIKKASRDMVYETSEHIAGEVFKGKNGKKIRKLMHSFIDDEIQFQEIDLLLTNISVGNKFTLGES